MSVAEWARSSGERTDEVLATARAILEELCAPESAVGRGPRQAAAESEPASTTASSASASPAPDPLAFATDQELMDLLKVSRRLLMERPGVLRLAAAETGAPLWVIGRAAADVFPLLYSMYRTGGIPCGPGDDGVTRYVIMGVEGRSKRNFEGIFLIHALHVLCPERVFLLRSAYDEATMSRIYGPYDSCKRYRSIKMWKCLVDVHNCLPIAAIAAETEEIASQFVDGPRGRSWPKRWWNMRESSEAGRAASASAPAAAAAAAAGDGGADVGTRGGADGGDDGGDGSSSGSLAPPAVLLCAGGGPSPEFTAGLCDLKTYIRPTMIPDSGLICDLLWSEPDADIESGWGDNGRSVSYTYASDVVDRFLQLTDLEMLVGIPSVLERGFEWAFHRGNNGGRRPRKMLNLFASPDYCGEFDNSGTICRIFVRPDGTAADRDALDDYCDADDQGGTAGRGQNDDEAPFPTLGGAHRRVGLELQSITAAEAHSTTPFMSGGRTKAARPGGQRA